MGFAAVLTAVAACGGERPPEIAAPSGDCVEVSAAEQVELNEACERAAWPIEIRNHCDSPVRIQSATVSRTGCPAEAPGCPMQTVTVLRARELSAGTVLKGTSLVTGDSVFSMTWTQDADHEVARTLEQRVEVAPSERDRHQEVHAFWPWPMDVLIVIDDSEAMLPHRDTVNSEIGRFFEYLDDEWRPARVAIATATLRNGRLGELVTDRQSAIALHGAKSVRRLRGVLENLSYRSRERARPLEAMRNALTGPDGGVAEWIDPARAIEVFVISAKEDPSEEPVSTFVAAFNAARERKVVPNARMGSAISVVLGAGESFCSGDYPATGRLADATHLTGGSWFSLCEPMLGNRLMREILIHDLDQFVEVCAAHAIDQTLPVEVTVDGRLVPDRSDGGAANWAIIAGTTCIAIDRTRVHGFDGDAFRSVGLAYTEAVDCP